MRHDEALQHAIRQGWEVRHDGGDSYSARFGGARYLLRKGADGHYWQNIDDTSQNDRQTYRDRFPWPVRVPTPT